MQPLRLFVFLLLVLPLVSNGQKYIDILFLKNDNIRYGSLQTYQPEKEVTFIDRESKKTETIAADRVDRIVQMRLYPTANVVEKIAVEDVLYLQNGSIFRGEIVKYEKGVQLEMKLYSGDQLIFGESEIQQIVQESLNQPSLATELFYQQEDGMQPYLGKKVLQAATKPYAFQEKGIYNSTYFGVLNGKSEGDLRMGINIHHNIGYLLTRGLGVGIGAGFDMYDVADSERVTPFYGELRGYFLKQYNSPYYAVAAGYGIALKNENEQIFDAEGGLFFRPTVGMRFGGRAGANTLLDIGYQIQKAMFSRENPLNSEIEIRRFTYKRLTVRVGLVF